MQDESIFVIDEPAFEAHEFRGAHPEQPMRLIAARQGLASSIAQSKWKRLTSRPVTDAELEWIHSRAYIARLRAALQHEYGMLDGDTYFNSHTDEAASLAAGGCIELVLTLLLHPSAMGFALVRPPGHHALPDRAMGFCLLNNIALAAASALHDGAQRIAIVDWDVHHGNGTQHIFYEDPRVLFISLHQAPPFYPGSGFPEDIGKGKGTGKNINVALPEGSGPGIYGESFRRLVMPVLTEFAPEIVLVSAGYDAHEHDPLAEINLDSKTFGAMAYALLHATKQPEQPRIAFVLEGGYDLKALEESVAYTARAVSGENFSLPEEKIKQDEQRALERTIRSVQPYWSALQD